MRNLSTYSYYISLLLVFFLIWHIGVGQTVLVTPTSLELCADPQSSQTISIEITENGCPTGNSVSRNFEIIFPPRMAFDLGATPTLFCAGSEIATPPANFFTNTQTAEKFLFSYNYDCDVCIDMPVSIAFEIDISPQEDIVPSGTNDIFVNRLEGSGPIEEEVIEVTVNELPEFSPIIDNVVSRCLGQNFDFRINTSDPARNMWDYRWSLNKPSRDEILDPSDVIDDDPFVQKKAYPIKNDDRVYAKVTNESGCVDIKHIGPFSTSNDAPTELRLDPLPEVFFNITPGSLRFISLLLVLANPDGEGKIDLREYISTNGNIIDISGSGVDDNGFFSLDDDFKPTTDNIDIDVIVENPLTGCQNTAHLGTGSPNNILTNNFSTPNRICPNSAGEIGINITELRENLARKLGFDPESITPEQTEVIVTEMTKLKLRFWDTSQGYRLFCPQYYAESADPITDDFIISSTNRRIPVDLTGLAPGIYYFMLTGPEDCYLDFIQIEIQDFTQEVIFERSGFCANNPIIFEDRTSLDPSLNYRWEWAVFQDDPKLNASQSAIEEDILSSPEPFTVTLPEGSYFVQLDIKETSGKNCIRPLVQEIFVAPAIEDIPITGTTFIDDELERWVAVGTDGENSWHWEIPNEPAILPSNTNQEAWILRDIEGEEKSYVYGPCITLPAEENSRPMIAIRMNNNTFEGSDGVVLQADSTGDGDWQVIGEVGTGNNWYTVDNVDGNPGEQNQTRFGWSGRKDWHTANHALDQYIGKSIALRMAFGSTLENPRNESFAFDSVWIGYRNKNVLLEYFANIQNWRQENRNIYNSLSNNTKDVVAIEYHINIGENDPLFELNPVPPRMRSLYYSINIPHRVKIDGISPENIAILQSSRFETLDNAITLRSLLPAQFTIDNVICSGCNTANNSIELSFDVANQFDTAREVIVYASILKDTINLFEFGDPVPNALISLKQDDNKAYWFPGPRSQERFTVSFDINQLPDFAKGSSHLIIFVQDLITKEVYQAYKHHEPIDLQRRAQTPDEIEENPYGLKFYPTPAVSNFSIERNVPFQQNWFWKLIDLRGAIVREGIFQSGQTQLQIPVYDLANGLYYLYLQIDELDGIKKKVMVLRE